MNNFKKVSVLAAAIILLAFVSGCSCNRNFAEGFWKGAAIGAAVGGAEGYILTNDVNNDKKNIVTGAAIGGFITGMINGFMNRCEEEVVETKVVDVDSDGDGVVDRLDQCPDTPRGTNVDYKGCPVKSDSDNDGVDDDRDRCPDTPRGVKVDSYGCPLDSDRDGVTDDKDRCPNTPRGVRVDAYGCPLDSDGDGVLNSDDKCPDTPKGAKVNASGCWVLQDVIFDFDKATIRSDCKNMLDEVADVLKSQAELKVEIQGHTCNIGSDSYNMKLSEKRAKAVMDYLVSKGISSSRMTSKGYGETRPTALNDTDEGRKQNRRAQIEPVK